MSEHLKRLKLMINEAERLDLGLKDVDALNWAIDYIEKCEASAKTTRIAVYFQRMTSGNQQKLLEMAKQLGG